jgi:hypothetical protein
MSICFMCGQKHYGLTNEDRNSLRKPTKEQSATAAKIDLTVTGPQAQLPPQERTTYHANSVLDRHPSQWYTEEAARSWPLRARSAKSLANTSPEGQRIYEKIIVEQLTRQALYWTKK